MKIAAIIAEYNPFTPGHLYHIQQTKELTNADAVVCIMSGNFVQRGEPAMFDKQIRTRMALEGGADIVFELPSLFATQTAELFSYGAVKVLNSLNCIDYLSFGSESDIAFLHRVASLLADEPYSYKKELAKNLSDKIPFARARTNAIATYFNLSEDEALSLSLPNSILAIEYLKKLIQLESPIQPIAVHRIGCGYNDDSEFSDYMSATGIRRLIKEGRFNTVATKYPSMIAKYISQQQIYAHIESFYELLQYAIMRSSPEELSKISGITEGIENLFISNVFAKSYDDFLEQVHSKRYTKTSIQRMTVSTLLNITKQKVERCMKHDECLYARILGFRQESSHVIKYIESKASIPVITNVPAYKKMLTDTTLFDCDIFASELYKLCTGLPAGDNRPDFKLVPIIRGNDFPNFL